MHELAIANSIVATVLKETEEKKLGPVIAIGLRIGALSDVVPEALEFGFTAITTGTSLEGAKLEIESVPVRGRCAECESTFDVHGFAFICPDCNSSRTSVEQGLELDIAYIEVEDSR